MPRSDPARLDSYMNARRLDLGLRWETVAAAAGISETGLRLLRRSPAIPRELTQRGLERALAWERGSVRRVIDGGEPVPLPGSPGAPDGEGDDRPVLVRSAWADETVREIWALHMVDPGTRAALVELYLRRNAEQAS